MKGAMRWSLMTGLLLLTLAFAMERDLEARLRVLAAKHFGQAAEARMQPWFDLMRAGQKMSEMEKLQQVNAFFNQLPNVTDMAHWGAVDYWATPLELLATNGGDCEDFVVAKYFTLRELGVEDERLRLTYVKAYLRDRARIESHMVLTYVASPGGEPLILDNLRNDIQPASRRPDLSPTYSFRGGTLWEAHERQSGNAAEADAAIPWPQLRLHMLRLEPAP